MRRFIGILAGTLLLFISCATTDIPADPHHDEQAAESPATTVQDEQAAPPADDVQTQTQQETADEKPAESSAPAPEQITVEQLPDMTEKETASRPEQSDVSADTYTAIDEPVVRDAPLPPESAVPAPKKENTTPAAESAAAPAAPEKQDAAPTAVTPAPSPSSSALQATDAAIPHQTSPAAVPETASQKQPAQQAQKQSVQPSPNAVSAVQKPATQKPAVKTAPQQKQAVPAAEKTAASDTATPAADTAETASAEKGNETTPADAETAAPPAPSRSVTIHNGQYLDITYPGTGWVYLGEDDGQKNMLFFGRKLGETETSFTLRARKTGTYLLHFYKDDILTGQYIDDYLSVTVDDAPVTDGQMHITAPRYADAVPVRPQIEVSDDTDSADQSVPSAPSAKTTAKTTAQPAAEQTQQTIQTDESAPAPETSQHAASSSSAATAAAPNAQETAASAPVPDTLSSDDLLKQAQDLYAGKKYADAYAYIEKFFEKAAARIDEGLYLQGEILEAKSPVQNIKAALDSYEILMKNWPDSSLWHQAQKRSVYLKRFYINIR